MKRWYFAASVIVVLSCPAAMMAQGNATGSTGGSTGSSTGNRNSSTSGGLAGTVNTTMLGNQVDLNFNSVFGNSASLANTYADPFSAYRPSGSGAGSGTGTGIGNAFAGGTGMGSGLGGTQRTGTGTGLGGGTGLGSGLGTGGLGTANRGGLGTTTGLGALGGGGLGAGGLGGNRIGGLGGGNALNMGGNRGMGGTGLFGGTGFLGGGGAGSFLGGGATNQQTAQAPMGYIVNLEGVRTTTNAGATALAPANDFQQRLLATPGFQGSQNIQVFTRGETAILQGKVTSDYAKQLAAAMVRLEPGVYEVDNKLEVVAPRQ